MAPTWSIKHVLLRTLIVALVLAALTGIGVLVFGTFGKIADQILMTTLTISFFSLTALGSAAAYERRQYSVLGMAGMAVAAAGFLFFVPSIWADWLEHEPVGKTMAVLGIFSFSFAHACLLSLAELKREVLWVLYAAWLAIFAFAAFLSVMIVFHPEGDWLFRLVGILGILDGCLSLCLPALHLLGARQAVAVDGPIGGAPSRMPSLGQTFGGTAAPPSGLAPGHIDLCCPRCGHRGLYPLGRIACPNCALVLRVEIEEGLPAPGA